ncbi:MAG: twin-arginine translocase TatA/TatE family subunit [Planctomycetota bacterium]|nr:MAG: twin-arginine translocase TatA/TatE family subunit [Planctomycetota bacterium]
MFGGLGPMEIIIILVVALIVFGRRLPEVGRALGRGIVEFRRGLREMNDEIQGEIDHRPSSRRGYDFESESSSRSESSQGVEERGEKEGIRNS